MGIISTIKRAQAKAHHAATEREEKKTRKVLLARNKAVKEADQKEKLAKARAELAAAKERKAAAQAKLDKNKKKTDWRKMGRDFFSHFAEPAPKRKRKSTKQPVTRRRAKRRSR